MNDPKWHPDTIPLEPADFDYIMERHPKIIGQPIWHRGDDITMVWPTPESPPWVK